ncbi:MAG: right-handed parallel beta-helix repeat-containing protein [Planctomycetaceae bacterium]|nr:right-handed parallel beta-helix repeat-containing protein [Planctomycetaceae bacterium]
MSLLRPFVVLIAVVSLLAVVASWRGTVAQSTASGGLPGAVAMIDASRYPTLQAALDALPATGGMVQLPAGKFEIATPLVISREDVLLVGQGTATQIVNTNTTGEPALIVRHPKYLDDKKQRLWRIKFADFRLVGNEKSGHGILAQGIQEIFIQGVTVSYHGGDGIRLDQCYEDPRVNDSLITYNKAAGLNLLGCHDIVVAGNQFEENQDALLCSDGFNLCMTGNCVDDHLRHGVVIENTYGSVLSGNMIEECQGVGVILDRDCYGITLSANVIAHEMSGGIALRDAHGCTVTGNSFPIVWKNALVVGPGCGHNTIVGNTFSDTYLGNGQTKRPTDKEFASGITLQGAYDTNISGNTFVGLNTKALTVTGEPSRRIIFANNVLKGVDSDH